MKASEARDMTMEELEERLRDTRHELFNLKMQQTLGQAEQPLRIRTLRRDVARILTVMNEKKQATEAGA